MADFLQRVATQTAMPYSNLTVGGQTQQQPPLTADDIQIAPKVGKILTNTPTPVAPTRPGVAVGQATMPSTPVAPAVHQAVATTPTPTAPAAAPTTPAQPAYSDWISSLANAYSKDPSILGEFGNQSSNYDNPNARAQFTQQLTNNSGVQGLYNRGVTVDQITNNPQTKLNNALTGLQNGTYGDKIPADVQSLIDSHQLIYNDSSTGNEGWAAPGLELQNGEAAYTPFNPDLYKDPNLVGYDPNHGVVTTVANQTAHPIMDALYTAIPSAMMGGMFAAALPGLAGTLMKLPGALGSLASNPTLTNLLGTAFSAAGGAGDMLSPGVQQALQALRAASGVYNMTRKP